MGLHVRDVLPYFLGVFAGIRPNGHLGLQTTLFLIDEKKNAAVEPKSGVGRYTGEDNIEDMVQIERGTHGIADLIEHGQVPAGPAEFRLKSFHVRYDGGVIHLHGHILAPKWVNGKDSTL